MITSLCFRRWSHIGKKTIYVDASAVKFDLKEVNKDLPFLNFRLTKPHWILGVEGPLGKAKLPIVHGLKLDGLPSDIQSANSSESEVQLKLVKDSTNSAIMSKHQEKFVQAMWGTTNALLRNMITGVTEGHLVTVRLVGVGYKASIENNGKLLMLKVGYSQDVPVKVPFGISASLVNPTKIALKGVDLREVTSFAAKLRAIRKPEPYSGKGIFVGAETIKLKEGKKK